MAVIMHVHKYEIRI